MPTLNTTLPSYADIAKRLDPNGKIDAIVEMLNQMNPIMEDAGIMECNDGTGHRSTIRTGLPTATWRRYNVGVQPSKATTRQVVDTCGMLEAYAEVDKALADLNGNAAAFRLSEDAAFLEAMSQEMVANVFYGNEATGPEKFTGFAARMNSTTAESGSQIVLAGGSGSDNTSIYFVNWGPHSCFLTYPKGSRAGFQHNDLGEVTLEDASGGRFQGYRTHYKWDLGFVMRDYRYNARIANIDISDVEGETGNSWSNLMRNMVQAYYKLWSLSMGRTVIYVNRRMAAVLHRVAMTQTNVRLTLQDWNGKQVLSFMGLPIKVCDGISVAESLVS